ncbi:Glycine betaine/proline betaine transport system ATP-binding protein ProV [BD1-7 clade bacterium]|uniref:Quaternary amine transport ATP-binding protein n=1 Tax=BD1-7 clade bacterium TaxID=2029982 RepID=A0A5S9PN20_9GAMM|nr:Glycine betaine/proline betaine transport system ATP-binding protein ProV [BD1-7 clade bacterium]
MPDDPAVKIEVKNLYKIFGNKPRLALNMLDEGLLKNDIFDKTGMTVGVNDANLQIYAGEIFVVMGLSGSGKSTLVRLLNRLIEPTAGQVIIDGQDISGVDTKTLRDIRRKKISMVFQSFALMPHLTVADNVAFGLELDGKDKVERLAKAEAALAQVGLAAYGESYPDELSGGMQQRVGLARALANDPDILLMDEAFSALDPLIRTEMQDELVSLQSEHQRTIVFISHDLDEAMRIGDRIAIMQGGDVVQVGTPDEILHNPKNDYIRSFFHGVDVGNVFSAADIARKTQVTVITKSDSKTPRVACQLLEDHDRDFGYVLNQAKQLQGVVSLDSLNDAIDNQRNLASACLDDMKTIPADTPIGDILALVASIPYPVPVVSEDNKYLGAISRSTLLKTLHRETDNV